MKSHSTAATAGATAYGQIRSVLYVAAPRIRRSAMTASSSAVVIERAVTDAAEQDRPADRLEVDGDR